MSLKYPKYQWRPHLNLLSSLMDQPPFVHETRKTLPPYMVWSRPLSNRGGFLKSFPSRYTFGRSLGTRCEGVCYIITNGDIVGDLSCGHTGPRVLVTGACLHRVTRLSAHIAVNREHCKANSDYYRVCTCGEYLVVTTTNIRSRNMSSPWLV